MLFYNSKVTTGSFCLESVYMAPKHQYCDHLWKRSASNHPVFSYESNLACVRCPSMSLRLFSSKWKGNDA